MEYNISEIVLRFNGKYSPGYQYTPAKKNSLPVILLCHGNYQEGKDSKIILSIAENLARKGFIVVTFDNLCYNKAWKPSDGEIHSCEEIDMRWAAFAAITYIRNSFNEKKIIVIGHSMGASIALSVSALSDYINETIAISPTRISAFIFDDNELYNFWMQNKDIIETKIDKNVTRSIRFDMMAENYIPLLCKKRTLFLCGNKERYFNYKKWIKSMAESIGENCEAIIIPNADHYFGIYPGNENPEVFDNLMNSIFTWINKKYRRD